MSKLNPDVTALFQETKAWILATHGENPNAVPILFKTVKDGELVLFHVFMDKTVNNVKKTGKAAVTAFSDSTLKGYQVVGSASYTTDPALVAEGNAVSSKFGLTVKGAVIVRPETVYVLTPGPDNGKTV